MMTDYIIDPKWFYWVHIADSIRAASVVVATVIFTCVGVIALMHLISFLVDDEPPEAGKKYIPIAKKATVIAIVIAFAWMLIPSRRTMIEMEIAKHATYQNIEEATDYILERLDDE